MKLRKLEGIEMKAETIREMAKHYGCSSKRGDVLLTIAALCLAAEKGRCYSDAGRLYGQIPSAIEMGSDFSQENMQCRLLGLKCLYPELISVLTTHDLDCFEIFNVGELISGIRIAAGDL